MPVAPLLHSRAVPGITGRGKTGQTPGLWPQEADTTGDTCPSAPQEHPNSCWDLLCSTHLSQTTQELTLKWAQLEPGRHKTPTLHFQNPPRPPKCSCTKPCHKLQRMPGASQPFQLPGTPVGTARAAHTTHRPSPVTSWGSQSPACHREGQPRLPSPFCPPPSLHSCIMNQSKTHSGRPVTRDPLLPGLVFS